MFGANNRAILAAIFILAVFLPGEAFGLAPGYTIIATSGPGGSISPSGLVQVKRDGKVTFKIQPDDGYDILDVVVDGESKGAVTSYKFSRVRSDHSIAAFFIQKRYTILATADAGGHITPSGEISVPHGSNQAFSMMANAGYDILDVVVDNASLGPLTEFTFTEVISDHSIGVTFLPVLRVFHVTIPDETMKIGDVIPVTISVEDDQGNPYSFVSGSVGGYPMTGFERISATTYLAYFTINQGGNSYLAGEDVPVSSLVITNGELQSAPYNLSISQSGDPIDAALPVINSMQVEGGKRKIGDVIILHIEADGLNYSLDPGSTINGIAVTAPNISFNESGGGRYDLRYTVEEGDPDVIPPISELRAEIILVKPSGNMGLPYSIVTGASGLAVDAHGPAVERMEVPSIEVGVGGTVKVKVTADGTGYRAGTGTMVNGIPLSANRVTFSELSDGLYELSYTVLIEDPDVAPGELMVSIAMSDPAGNVAASYATLEPNRLEIYTSLPEAALAGSSQVCEGEEVELSVFLAGRLPLTFELSDGTGTTSYSNISSEEYKINAAPVQTTTYQITSVTDVNGVQNLNAGSIQVKVNEKTRVEIINLASGYNVESDPFKLEANVPGGTFSGPGVSSTSGIFYPGIADTVNSPHTILYTYKSASGCTSVASKQVYVLGAKGAILIPGQTVCKNNEPFEVEVLNLPEVTGSFRLLNAASQPVPGLIDHGDNTATIDPDQLSLENYVIEYRYVDVATLYLRKEFIVESASQPQILNLTESPYCQSAVPFLLQSNLGNVVFEGPGVSGNADDGFTFNPKAADPGNISITCTTISGKGCKASTDQRVQILFAPEVIFEMSSICIPEGGEVVSFENLTSGKATVETWNWNFGDTGSGQQNQSDLVHPTHHYLESGFKSISLTATTSEGCVSRFELETIIDSQPVADFTWDSDCYSAGSEVKFINKSGNESAAVDTIIWRFKTADETILGEIGSSSPDDTAAFPFSELDRYLVQLYTRNVGGCSSEITKEFVLKPTIQLSGDGYHENFDQTGGGWSVHSQNQVESWVWGRPDFKGHPGVESDLAWYTQLPTGVTGYMENSWIQSPCFDFTGIDRPVIRMDVMRSFVPALSGAVLQYRDAIEEEWKVIGESTPGIGWYNSENISGKPGGSRIGWSLEEFKPDSEWMRAVHDLDQVAGKRNVAFRIAIASSGDEGMGNQGFAFDNVAITERLKLAVLEYFTDCSDDNSRISDDLIDGLASKYSKDVIDLQYHMSYKGLDPIYENNPDPTSTRSFNYGVPRIPYALLDGGMYPFHRYDFSELKSSPVDEQLRLLTLENPEFDIDLVVDWMESSLEAHTRVTCLDDRFEENVQLYVVVFETSVTAFTGRNGDSQFRNVVLDMLPTPAGKLIGDNWFEGMNDIRSQPWAYSPFVEDISDLAVAAFLQDRSTGRILQAAVEYMNGPVFTGDPESAIRTLNIYPNPAQRIIYMNTGSGTLHAGSIELLDLNGKVVRLDQVPAGYQVFQLEIDDLEDGIYILRWIESGMIRGIGKFVKIR